jgi:hypothetical protein
LLLAVLLGAFLQRPAPGQWADSSRWRCAMACCTSA